jgi:4-amino-4-deoxy-L-arabinose transferase-like glycosyltransferase
VSPARRRWLVLILFATLIAATRIPRAPGQLVTFDSVNLAYSIGHFDIRISQPHPPGYPLFVMEMRALWWLRFRRVENILFALALAGSIAAAVLVALCGNRIMGGDSGYCAAWILIFNPVFWHAGLTSALRVQLAVVSMAVAAGCWRAWAGEGRWVLRSAVALGIGAGIRPELGPLLLPLWAASALRARISWRERGIALGAMAAAVAVWLAPAMLASGGPAVFVKTCLEYLDDQASTGSALFGASESQWRTTFWRLMVWVFGGAIAWTLPAVLAWRRGEGWAIGRERLAFLALWLVPPFVFSLLVLIADPGHVLAMLPVVALIGGYLINRALDNVGSQVGRGHALVLATAAAGIAWIVDRHTAEFAIVWVPVACLAAGLLLKIAPLKNVGYLPRWQAFVFLIAPVVLLGLMMFNHRGWYYRRTAVTGWRASAEQITSDLNSGLAMTSYDQIESTLAIDDGAVREVRRLSAGRPGNTVAIWEHGLASWRKVAYYVPGVPIVLLEHRKIRASPPLIAIWKGPRLEQSITGPTPQRIALPAGTRIVWLLNPTTEFYRLARQAFPMAGGGPVYYTDLIEASGSRVLGEYELAW